MTKEQAIDKLIGMIYDYDKEIVISREEIKDIEEEYKKVRKKCTCLNDFLGSNPQLKSSVEKLTSGKVEIDNQLKAGKALQPGILAECVFMQTLAKILGLRTFIDFEKAPIAKLPKELTPYVKGSADTLCAARYGYINRNDTSTALFQYGNPKAGDAQAIIYSQGILIEIKDMPALLMDKDLLYDDDGKILITDDIKRDFPDYISVIESFNADTSIIRELGSNYKLFAGKDAEIGRKMMDKFFNTSTIDLIVSTSKNKLVALKPTDINFVFSDGTSLIDISDSEIRTAGKNSRVNAFTPKFLEKVLREYEVIRDGGVCKISFDNKKIKGKTKGRGTAEYSRLKINEAFFVRAENVTERGGCYEFSFDKIEQCKSGISLHMILTKNKEEIRKYLYS